MSLASRGLRDMDGGVERVEDELERRALRAQARRVHLKSLSLGVVATGLAVATALLWP